MKASVAVRIAAAIAALTMTLSVLGLAGCDLQDNDSDSERIAELEREVEQLKSQQPANDASANADSGADANDESGQTGQGVAASVVDAATLDFSERADALIAEADAATPPSDRAELVSLYFDFDARFDALEDEIDRYGDQKEMEFRNDAAPWEEYRAIDAQLDGIEARLDSAKDRLERRFGIDD